MKCEKMDKYDYLIALATLEAKDDDVEMFAALDDSEVVFSDRIKKRIGKMIRRESKCRTKGCLQFRNALSKVAIIILITVSVIFTAMMSVTAIRSAIFEIITEWYEEYIAIGYIPEDETKTAEPPTRIEEIRKPTLLPLGAEEEIAGSSKTICTHEYYIGDECCVTFHQLLLTAEAGKIDGESVEMEEISVGPHKAYLFIYDREGYMIDWTDGEYAYRIITDVLSREDLISIAQSVK